MYTATSAISTPVFHNAQRATRKRASVPAGTSTFVPKVPFQRPVTLRTPAAKV